MSRAACSLAAAALAAAVLLPQAAEAKIGPLTERHPKPQNCQLPRPIAGKVQLKRGCVYRQPLAILQSNTEVDCRGAVFTGFKKRAVWIKSGLQNVKVSDCRFIQTGGIYIQGPKLRNRNENRDAARKRSSKNVVISNVTVSGSTMTGVFIDHFVVGATVQNSIVEDTTTSGIYLEFGSQKNVIRNNIVRRNGHKTNDGMKRVALTRREGLAIDGSALNLIQGNRFVGNAIGGILLYKNCQEFHSSEPNQLPRLQHAHSNVLSNNVFRDMPIGIWVAARQSRDLGTWDCGDRTPYNNPVPLGRIQGNRPKSPSDSLLAHRFNMEYLAGFFTSKDKAVGNPMRDSVSIWLDYAERTQIIGNRFQDVKTGIRIEDDHTVVQENFFIGDFEYIYLGSPFRAQILNRPIKGTRIVANSFLKGGGGYEGNITVVPGEHVGTAHVPGGPGCQTPWGWPVASGRTVKAFAKKPNGQSCTQEQRTCTNGRLTGSFQLPRCN